MKKKVVPISRITYYVCECGERLEDQDEYCFRCNAKILWGKVNGKSKKKD